MPHRIDCKCPVCLSRRGEPAPAHKRGCRCNRCGNGENSASVCFRLLPAEAKYLLREDDYLQVVRDALEILTCQQRVRIDVTPLPVGHHAHGLDCMRVTVMVTPDLKRAVDEVSSQTGASLSTVTRQALLDAGWIERGNGNGQ